jgi:TonB-dependent outer membrane receptor, SusC/RagA subfamily, signature region
MLFWLLLASSSSFAQNGKVSLDIKSETLDKILIYIKDVSGQRIIFNENQLNKVTLKNISFRSLPIKEAIDLVLEGTSFKCEIVDGVYVIKLNTHNQPSKRITVTGYVLDVNKQPLPGVYISLKNSSTIASTDENGNYSITFTVVNTNPVLVFSFVGMETREIAYRGNNVINVTLKEDAAEIKEVVITGFQTLNKREATSSIVTLKAKDIIEPVGTSVDQMIQGKVAGMSVMQMTSTIGAAPKIRIRGSSTIIGNREPVWVLDGVVLTDPVKLDATELNSMDRVNLIGNAISGLNPEDIDRIDVLKDASATALYGSKAANGVIVITTKRGKVGAPIIRYSNSISFISKPTYNKLDRMNSNERIELSQEIEARGLQYNGFSPSDVGYEGALKRLWDGKISMEQFNREVKNLKEVNTDWYDLLFRNSFSNSHTLSVSGGSNKTTYYFSVGYSNQQGAQLKEKGERFNFMTNLNFNLTKRLTVNAIMSSSINTIGRPTEDLYKYAYNTSRAIPAYNADGSYCFMV